MSAVGPSTERQKVPWRYPGTQKSIPRVRHQKIFRHQHTHKKKTRLVIDSMPLDFLLFLHKSEPSLPAIGNPIKERILLRKNETYHYASILHQSSFEQASVTGHSSSTRIIAVASPRLPCAFGSNNNNIIRSFCNVRHTLLSYLSYSRWTSSCDGSCEIGSVYQALSRQSRRNCDPYYACRQWIRNSDSRYLQSWR